MSNLKALRTRINSVKSTQKITSAMKMVATAKYHVAQARAKAARPYTEAMARMMAALASGARDQMNLPELLVGARQKKTHLLVAVAGDRGLAGAFNSNIGRATRKRIDELQSAGMAARLFPVGRKSYEYLKRDLSDKIIGHANFVGKKNVEFCDADAVSQQIVKLFRAGEFDICTLVFNRFVSTMVQTVTEIPLIPAAVTQQDNAAQISRYSIEPEDGTLLDQLVVRNLAVQLYSALLENSAGLYASQMTAMDGASRNAGEMIKRLTLNYNQVRQANITNELIEIIAASESRRS